MITSNRAVEGTLLRLRCQECLSEFPHFIFAGEDDLDTEYLSSASACDTNEIVLFQVSPDIWEKGDDSRNLLIEMDLEKMLGRNDFRVVRLLRVEEKNDSAAGLSFQDFMKSYRPPVLVFSCPCCNSGESHSIGEMTIEEFESTGGRILVGEGLMLIRQ